MIAAYKLNYITEKEGIDIWQKMLNKRLKLGPSSFTEVLKSLLKKGVIIHGLVTTMLYVVIFGLIFTLLQQKRDLTSAMLAHGLVDCVRFSFSSLPIKTKS